MHKRFLRLLGVATITCSIAAGAVVANVASAAPVPYVTNGKPASRAAFDARWGFIVSVQLVYPSGKPNDLEQHTCGGSLIAPNLVLTAEHCTPMSVRTLPLTTMKLQVLAKHRTLKSGSLTTEDRVDVTDVWHYDAGSGDGELLPTHDVAILKLARPIDAPTIRLVGADERALWGGGAGLAKGAMLGGWGIAVTNPNDDEDDYAGGDEEDEREPSTVPELQEVGIPLIADRVCETSNSQMANYAREFDPETMLCAGALDSKQGDESNRRGACFGDSGGPLIVPDTSGGWRLAGVVSWGPGHKGGCNSFSIFARVDGLRDWINTTIAANGPAVTSPAPTTLSATPSSVNTLRVTWPAGTGVAPRHVALIREYSLRDEYTDLGYEPIRMGSIINPRVRAEARAWAKTHENITLGVGGPHTRSLTAVDVAPRRPGVRKLVKLRIATTARDGVTDVSPSVFVDAPIDDTAPKRPQAPRMIGTQRGAVKLWWRKVSDDDCVRRYIVQIRMVGRAAWTNRSSRDAGACPDLEAKLSGGDEWSWGGRISSVLGRIFGRPNDFRATRMRAGTYQVRIVALDRAGNRSIGSTATVRVPKTITAAADKLTGKQLRDLFEDAFDEVSSIEGDEESAARGTRATSSSMSLTFG